MLTCDAMNRPDPGRLEARIGVGALSVAALVLAVALAAGASVPRAALLAFLPLALGAAAMFVAWRRTVDRNGALEAALKTANDNLADASAARSAAEAEVTSLREVADAPARGGGARPPARADAAPRAVPPRRARVEQ
jgi:hypothetical protein